MSDVGKRDVERLLRAHYRAERGAPISRPTCPYDATFPRGMRRTTSNTLSEKSPMPSSLLASARRFASVYGNLVRRVSLARRR